MLAEIGESMNYMDLDALFAAIGEHHVSARSVVGRVERQLSEHAPEVIAHLSVAALAQRPLRRDRGSVGVHVEGLDDVMVRLSRCCTPVPPDGIKGFVTRGRGVSVHRTDCANAVSLSGGQPDRLIDVDWDEQTAAHFVASFEVKALDRPLLLRDVVAVLADHRVNVLSTSTVTSGTDRVARMRFEFEMGDASHLERVLHQIREIDSVYDVYRVVPGHRA